MRALFVAAAAAAALPLFPIASVNAEQGAPSIAVRYTGTLAKINDSGAIRIGHRENSPPFAFRDAAGKPVGYSLDLCEIVVEIQAGSVTWAVSRALGFGEHAEVLSPPEARAEIKRRLESFLARKEK